MALTMNMIQALTAMAGDDFTWRGIGGTSRPASATRRGLRAYLYAVQGTRCADCGQYESNPAALEFCHVVSRGLSARTSDEGKGWTVGNLFLGHRVCPTTDGTVRGNKAQQMRGPVVLPEHLTRPDLVADWWPTVPELKRMAPAPVS
jgi:hypothetical protein